MTKLRLLIGVFVIGASGSMLAGCGPNVNAPPGGCVKSHHGYATVEPNHIQNVFPYTPQELAQVDSVGGWESSGWGSNCVGWQVGNPYNGVGTNCSGDRNYVGLVVIHTGACTPDTYENATTTPGGGVTFDRNAGLGYFWSGGGGAGAFDAYAFIRARNDSAVMEHGCYVTGSLPGNTSVDCRHHHDY